MKLIAAPAESYLGASEFIQSGDPAIRALSAELRVDRPEDEQFARAAFEWVRDRVDHSYDVQDPRVTISATAVLDERVGLCYAKAHLLVALLRAEGIPAGLCYQRLADEGMETGHVLHGLIALHLAGEWHRQDPRGNKPGVDAQFSLHDERLAWNVNPLDGEVDYPIVYEAPVAGVVAALQGTDDILALYQSGLPDGLTDEESRRTDPLGPPASSD